jgi:ribosome-associated toxin RatA of RatAB toxin-antitoxin module
MCTITLQARRGIVCLPVLASMSTWIMLTTAAVAADFSSMIRRSPLLYIDRDLEGRFVSASGYVIIDARPEQVRLAVLDIEHYPEYMPNVVRARTVSRSEDGCELIADFELEVPLRNSRYTLRFKVDGTGNNIDVFQVKGDIPGSHFHWRLIPQGDSTLVIYTGTTINYSAILAKLEDRQETITVGVNITAVMTTMLAVKKRAEQAGRLHPR